MGLLVVMPAAAGPVLALSAGEPVSEPLGGASVVAALADPVLWYNGDRDLVNGLANESNTRVSDAVVYDNFIVPAGETWEVQRVWTNNFMDFSAEFATWEIRQGVSAGNGGTLIASGTDPCIVTATGAYAPGWTAEYEYTVEVQGLSILLGEGEYWLAVVPIGFGDGRSFCSTTSGDNAIGQPQGEDGDAYFTSGYFGYSFEPTTNVQGPEGHDYSMGVAGELVGGELIPEPATLSLVGLGLLLAAARRRRRR